MLTEHKVAIRKVVLTVKRATGFLLTTMPLAHFLFGIDTIQDLKAHPFLGDAVNFALTYRWVILGLISLLFFATYIVSYSVAYHDPISTGGHLKAYERTKMEKIYSLRHLLSEKSGSTADWSLVDQIKEYAQDICDCIVELMNYNFDKSFSVCVKLVEIKSSKSTTSPEQIQLTTFCRSGEHRVDRSEHDSKPIPLQDNSDFLWIFEGADCFCCGHLWWYTVWHNKILDFLGLGESKKYYSTTEKYWKRYLSTVVVPIKLKNDFVQNKFVKNNKRQDQLIGFLCIDYKKRLSNSVLHKMLPYMVAFADGFYSFFDEFITAQIEILKQVESAEDSDSGAE